MCGRKLVFILLFFLPVLLSGQELSQEESYLISESQRQQLLQLLQSLSDKAKNLQLALEQSEKDLNDAQTQLRLSEESYNRLVLQYRELEQAWIGLTEMLETLTRDSQLLTQSYQVLADRYSILETVFKGLEIGFQRLQAEYNRLVGSYQSQSNSLIQLQESFTNYQKEVNKLKNKELFYKVLAILIATGWGLDAVGVF